LVDWFRKRENSYNWKEDEKIHRDLRKIVLFSWEEEVSIDLVIVKRERERE
jgi:hypothetical protein